MRVPSIKRILPERFPDQKWIPELLSPLNQFMEQVAQGINNGLRIGENFDGVVRTVVVDMTQTNPFPVKFQWTRTSPPSVAWIGRARQVSGTHTNFTSALFIDWEMADDGSFKINAIPGLPGLKKFNVTVIALAE